MKVFTHEREHIRPHARLISILQIFYITDWILHSCLVSRPIEVEKTDRDLNLTAQLGIITIWFALRVHWTPAEALILIRRLHGKFIPICESPPWYQQCGNFNQFIISNSLKNERLFNNEVDLQDLESRIFTRSLVFGVQNLRFQGVRICVSYPKTQVSQIFSISYCCSISIDAIQVDRWFSFTRSGQQN